MGIVWKLGVWGVWCYKRRWLNEAKSLFLPLPLPRHRVFAEWQMPIALLQAAYDTNELAATMARAFDDGQEARALSFGFTYGGFVHYEFDDGNGLLPCLYWL